MRRIISLLVVVSAIFSFAAAADEPAISYDNIGEYIKSGSPQLSSLKITIEGMDSSIRSMQSSIDTIAIDRALDTQISKLYDIQVSASMSGKPLSADELASNNLAISGLQQQKINAQSSVTAMNAARDSLKKNLEVTRISLNSTRELLIYTAQSLISGYYSAYYQREAVAESITRLNDTIPTLETLYRLGLSTSESLDTVALNIKNLQNTEKTITQSLDKIKCNLNLLIGRNADAELKIADFAPAEALNLDGKLLSEEDYESEFNAAYEKNYSIASLKLAYDQKSASDSNITESRTARISLESARNEFKSNFRICFDDVFNQYNQIELARLNLISKQNSFKITQAKFDAGVISKNAYTQEKNALEDEERKIITAQINYMNTYLKFCAYRNGATPQ